MKAKNIEPKQSNLPKLAPERAAAEIAGVTVRTLQGWRMRGTGPPFYRISRRAVRYELAELIEWLRQFRIEARRGTGAR